MTVDEFKGSLSRQAPAPNMSPALRSLWWAAKGDWEKAHTTVQNDGSRDAAWVHAYLHRVEGDLPNASYWYRTAGKPAATGGLAAEWDAMAAALLGA